MKVVAVIGASRDPNKFGNKAVRAFRQQGFHVVPVNPDLAVAGVTVEGLTVYASVLEVQGTIDLATLYVPPEVGVRVVREVAKKNIRELWVNPGAESRSLVALAECLGLNTKLHCSIIAIGESPADYE